MQTAAANEHDATTLLPLVIDIPAVAQARPSQKQTRLAGGRQSFRWRSVRALVRWLGIEPCIPHRGEGQCGLGKVRWFIERTISWFHQFRRLRIRWERNPDMHQVFLSLAATVICYRLWINGN